MQYLVLMIGIKNLALLWLELTFTQSAAFRRASVYPERSRRAIFCARVVRPRADKFSLPHPTQHGKHFLLPYYTGRSERKKGRLVS